MLKSIINKDINNNIKFDSNIKKLQQNLFLMGFDIICINKVITYFNITSESEAIDYLIKGEDGMWNHPFIPKEEETKEEILGQSRDSINNVLDKIESESRAESRAMSEIDIKEFAPKFKQIKNKRYENNDTNLSNNLFN